MKEGKRKPFSGKVLTLGRQDIYFSDNILRSTAKDLGYNLKNEQPTFSLRNDYAKKGFISDVYMLKCIGFKEVISLDYSDYESAQIVFDLNNTNLPDNLIEGFDMIIDGGTIEHVFHIPNAMYNIFRMLRIGGRIIHFSPSSNLVDHGFYMLSPTFFFDFYNANSFEVNHICLFRYTQNHDTEPWTFYDNYSQGSLDSISFGGLDDGIYGVLCIATKTENSMGDRIPQQGSYIKHWKTNKNKTVDYRSQKLIEITEKIKEFDKNSIAIYGTGNHTKILLPYIEKDQYKIIGLLDYDANKVGQNYYGFTVYNLNEITDRIKAVIISSDVFQEVIYERIKILEAQGIKVIKIYDDGIFQR
ncbi:MAG: hypothetical protein N2645_16490 [Clostridia bacterium]|nr:hypothetical protein [Clostridia bacterium]